MTRFSIPAFSGWLLASLSVLAQAGGADTAVRERPGEGLTEILKLESQGSLDSRTAALKGVLRHDAGNIPARWQAGQVKLGIHWQNYKVVPEEMKRNRDVRKYRAVRDTFPKTAKGHRELADWCRDHGLPERERAHLIAALQLSKNPNDPVLRKRLGWRLVNGQWVKHSDIAAATKAVATIKRNRKAWVVHIRGLVLRLKNRRHEVRDAATKELKSISDPAAIPALEAVLGDGSLEHAQLLVEILTGMKTHHAADALARVAVFCRWDAVRKTASKKLRSRPIESFAPELLAALRTPINSRMGLYVGQGGVHLVHYATSETQGEIQAIAGRSSTLINPIGLRATDSIIGADRQRGRIARATSNAAIGSRWRIRDTQRTVTQRNDAIKAWNNRICEVLADGTGVVLPADPQKWWEWWQDFNQLPRRGDKESQSPRKEYRCYYYYETRTENVDVSEPIFAPSPELVRSQTRPCECLVAGTPIWTDRGFVKVEKVKVGDLVLAKNAATGELTYQPVLRTTIRASELVLRVTTDKGTIRATGGHTFWISGKGWTKLKLSKPGDRFHTATGTAIIKKLEQDGREKMYNLVVEDVHSYFVGKQMVLSHDVTFAQPSDTIVPGLSILDVQPRRTVNPR